MNYFCHENSIVETDKIGKDSRIWAFSHILPGAKIGSDCNICDHVFIENDVVIGNRVTVKCGVQLWDGLRVADNVFIGPNATFTNDLFPRSKQKPEQFTQTIIQHGASIGANATVLAGNTIGANSMIGAGAVVTKDVPPNAIVIGNPAQITGYVSTTPTQQQRHVSQPVHKSGKIGTSKIKGAQFYHLPIIPDMRGSLSFAEYGQYLPFIPKRYFIVFDVPNREIRGEHAHKELHQFLVCIKGSCSVMIDDGTHREEYNFNTPKSALHIPPMVWGVQYKYSPDAVLLVLTSDLYDPDDYIRDYDEFLTMVNRI